MASSSMASITRRISRSLLINSSRTTPLNPIRSCTIHYEAAAEADDRFSDIGPDPSAEPGSTSSSSSSSSSTFSAESTDQKLVFDRPLENGLDAGVYRAILVGQVGQIPVQKKLRSGRVVTIMSMGTGGMRNNRRPLDHEDPKDYANRCAVQWHRVSIHPERLGDIAMKHALPGSTLYVEGNLETKVFTDPITGLVRRIREIAVRQNGRLVFLGDGGDNTAPPPSTGADLKGVGYY